MSEERKAAMDRLIADDADLIDIARDVWVKAVFDYGGQSIPGEGEERATRVIVDHITYRTTALIEAGDALERYAVHELWCEVFYGPKIKCSCGYTEAVKNWREAKQ